MVTKKNQISSDGKRGTNRKNTEAAILRRIEDAERQLADIHRRRLEIVRSLTEKIENRRLKKVRKEIKDV